MKAKTLLLILCVSMICLTGFGNTTADLSKNSTTDVIQTDLSATVGTAINVEVTQLEMIVKKVPDNVIILYDSPQIISYNKLNAVANVTNDQKDQNNSLNYLLDVGWHYDYDVNLTPDIKRDPTGVLSNFYI